MQIQYIPAAADPAATTGPPDSAHPLSTALACQAPAPNDVLGFTIWPNMAATAKLDMRLAWPAVCALIAQEGAQPAKPHCRWVKLATFGQLRTAKGCLRHDANVRQVFGIEGDYDDEVMTPEEAIERLERHQLKALVYTSWSHTPETPRWRVLLPLSGPIAPAARQAYAEALNGLLGGILAPESGVLSQSYFFGHPPGAPSRVLYTFDDPQEGSCLDTLDAWQQYRIPFASHATTADRPAAPQPPAEALADLLSGDDIHGNALRLVGRMVREGVTDAMIRATFQILAQQVEAMRGADRAQALLGGELTRMIRGARDWQARGQTDREDQRRRESAALDQSADSDFLTPPPRPTEAMFYGLTGEVARTAAAGREVNPVSVAAVFLSWLSGQVGRDVYLQVGDVRHPVPLFTLHVGRTAIAAKGESTGLPLRIDEAIRQSPLARLGPEQPLLGQTHAGGLSSREGLTLFVHDGYKSGRDDIPSIEDKRLWVFEPEFQNVIAQGKREGNTLSAALRDVWDGGSIKPATKGGRTGRARTPINQ